MSFLGGGKRKFHEGVDLNFRVDRLVFERGDRSFHNISGAINVLSSQATERIVERRACGPVCMPVSSSHLPDLAPTVYACQSCLWSAEQ